MVVQLRDLEGVGYNSGSGAELWNDFFVEAFHGVGKEIANNYICVAEVFAPKICIFDFCFASPEW